MKRSLIQNDALPNVTFNNSYYFNREMSKSDTPGFLKYSNYEQINSSLFQQIIPHQSMEEEIKQAAVSHEV